MNERIKEDPWKDTPWEEKLGDGYRFEDFDPNSNFQIKLTYYGKPGYGTPSKVELIAMDLEIDSALRLLDEQLNIFSGSYHIGDLERLNKLRTLLDEQISKDELIKLVEKKHVLDGEERELAAKKVKIETLQRELSEGIRALLKK